jgi:hypothetical protein
MLEQLRTPRAVQTERQFSLVGGNSVIETIHQYPSVFICNVEDDRQIASGAKGHKRGHNCYAGRTIRYPNDLSTKKSAKRSKLTNINVITVLIVKKIQSKSKRPAI